MTIKTIPCHIFFSQEDVELRKKAQNEWWNMERSLLSALRTHSKSAYDAKDLSEEEMHKFFMSGEANCPKHL